MKPDFSLILPISSIFLGYQTTLAVTRFQFHFIELLGASFPVGFVLNSYLALILNPFLKCTKLHFYIQVCFSFVVGLILFILNHFYLAPKRKIKLPSFPTLCWLSICISFCIFISYLAYMKEPGKLILAGENDLYLEFAYISSFSNGINYDQGLKHVFLPTVAGNQGFSEYLPTIYLSLLQKFYSKNLNNVFFSETFNKNEFQNAEKPSNSYQHQKRYSTAENDGKGLQFSVFITTSLFFTSIVFLQFSYTFRLSQNEFSSSLSIPVIFLCGGFGFLHFLNSKDRRDPNVDYVFNLGSNKFNMWGHPILHCILTSRVVLYTMSLSILTFLFLEIDYNIFAFLLVFFVCHAKPQTCLALSLVFLFYKAKKMLLRGILVIPLLYYVIFHFFHLSIHFFYNENISINRNMIKNAIESVVNNSLMFYSEYNNTMFPFLTYPFAIFGLLFATLVFSTKFTGKLIASLFTFYLLTFIGLQENIRFNFFAILSVIVPIFSAISFAGMMHFTNKWSNSPDIVGSLKSLMFFIMVFMCLSSIAGIYSRINQKFVAWDKNDITIADWILNNVPRHKVFASQVPGNWIPSTILAGRAGFFGYNQWMQSTKFDNGNRESAQKWCMQTGNPIEGVDYYAILKGSSWLKNIQKNFNTSYEIVYENDKYYLLIEK
ncbi:hypothetical protein TRFO_19412 [Tritrichomonas foetus]|uniref:Uncharacterized protein n=1 Tax=Tritrichomonas foetus TaxID=1144522 RepID=A0A1J4KJA8_9EUKA|nr:hypothetical protein TRFO_19412 [Tritrichomonas foetus]|eukprot:OHT11024.1 hypothetical protein TRFO_19412 [Tritrichomonas foetus]